MPNVRLLTYERLDDLWSGALEAWFQARGGVPGRGAPSAVVLAPDGVRLGGLKRAWLAGGGGPLLGVRFWTPGQLRRHLLAHHFPALRLATAEDLALAARLLLAGAAEDSPLGVVERDPSGFLQSWDAWSAAKGQPDLMGSNWRHLPGRLEAFLEEVGLVSVRTADARLAGLAVPARPVLGPILVDGFSALQASVYPLLRAALKQSLEGTCTFSLPRSRSVEELWLGSFEAEFATASELVVEPEGEGPFAIWAQRAEAGEGVETPPEGVAFRLFAERADEAGAVVERVRSLLGQPGAEAIAVVLPEEPLLQRAVVGQLVAAGIPVHDTFGYYPVVGGPERQFAAWIAWQRSGRLVEADGLLEEQISAGLLAWEEAEDIRRAWKEARERLLCDESAVVAAYLEGREGTLRGASAALAWARAWPRLPDSAGWALYGELCRPAFASWGGEREFSEAWAGWSLSWGQRRESLERGLFLDWLWGSLRRPGRARDAGARDAFAPVQVISYEMIRSGHWSHMLLAGLNERLVPAPSRESAYLVPEAAVRHLARHRVAGPQGEGHEAIEPGVGFLLDDNARRALLSGALLDAIAETTGRVELFATYAPEGADRGATVLSEYFQLLFRSAHGAEVALPPVEGPPAPPPDAPQVGSVGLPLAATARALERRLDRATPFDGYSFGWAEPPAQPLEFGAREWEALLRRPATVWLEAVARVRPVVDFAEPISLSLFRGSAVHRLLRWRDGAAWHRLDEAGAAWIADLKRQADFDRERVERAHLIGGRTVSLLWREQWGKVVGAARDLAALVKAEGEGRFLTNEFTLPDDAVVALPGEGFLRLRGRLDALLVDDPEQPGRAWVVDFKTGGDAALKPSGLRKGVGMQLVLYGGALATAWRCPVDLSLLKPDDASLASQLTLRAAEDPTGLLPGLGAIGRRGVLGFAGAVTSEFSFVGHYPLAFVPPPEEIVEAKWALTHSDLPLPEGTA